MTFKIKDCKAMIVDELEARLVECKKDHLSLRIQQASGQLQNPSALSKVRKEVAQINTLLTERKQNS